MDMTVEQALERAKLIEEATKTRGPSLNERTAITLLDEIRRLQTELSTTAADRDSWQQQASDRLADAAQFIAERDAAQTASRHEADLAQQALDDLRAMTEDRNRQRVEVERLRAEVERLRGAGSQPQPLTRVEIRQTATGLEARGVAAVPAAPVAAPCRCRRLGDHNGHEHHPLCPGDTAPVAWADAEAISNAPDVGEAIRALLDDHTGDNAAEVVRAVLRHAAPPDAAQVPLTRAQIVAKEGGAA